MIKRLGIVGSGIMGSGIAEVAAKAGIEVILRSRQQQTADAMVTGLGKSLDKQIERGTTCTRSPSAISCSSRSSKTST
jgi:3-hydroxybutyryl-CoA dehydrogenase